MRATRGFTLVELLVVVAIIGILVAIAVVNYVLAQVRAKVSQCKADMRTVETALEWYRSDNGEYPDGSLGGYVPGSSIYNWRLRVLTSPIAYVQTLPMDPFNQGKSIDYSAERPHQTTYDYNTRGALLTIWTGLGTPLEQAEQTWLRYYGLSEWKLVGIGPNARFAPDDWGGIKYDPTNGIRSQGDLVLTQALRFQE